MPTLFVMFRNTRIHRNLQWLDHIIGTDGVYRANHVRDSGSIPYRTPCRFPSAAFEIGIRRICYFHCKPIELIQVLGQLKKNNEKRYFMAGRNGEFAGVILSANR